MTETTGTLIVKSSKTKTSYMVKYTNPKGKEVTHNLKDSEIRFAPQEAKDGAEVVFDLVDGQLKNIRLVDGSVIPGGLVRESHTTGGRRRGGKGPQNSGDPRGRAGSPESLKNKLKAPPSSLGLPFHNPYTFLPFGTPRRNTVTSRTCDETLPKTEERYTGILELQITTQRPLLTSASQRGSSGQSERADTQHQVFQGLTIGNDVVVPSTGVKGALRTLLTVLTGGTLGYVNPSSILCQARDLSLAVSDYDKSPKDAFGVLARIRECGNVHRAGTLCTGETVLVNFESLEHCPGPKPKRDAGGEQDATRKRIFVALGERSDKSYMAAKTSGTESEECPYEVKLSGQPVGPSKNKREGAFRESGRTITLPASLWSDYEQRYMHGPNRHLKSGDLIWLELAAEPQGPIKASDVVSIQAARWGRRGERMVDAITKHSPDVLPDYLRADQKVDEVTNLFGQVNVEHKDNVGAFASRVRPDNLVFSDAKSKLNAVPLATLSSPHPGCVAFYRKATDPDTISREAPLRGYKVYRVGADNDQPWRYENQAIYNDSGREKHPQQKTNFTADLLPQDTVGQLQIAFRSLSKRELSLLQLACSVPWRLGGGKPLGLGLCKVEVTSLTDELGEAIQFDWRQEVTDLKDRAHLWEKSQQPVPLLRYPRAVDPNNNKNSRGGHVWFVRHATPNKASDQQRAPVGMQPLHIGGDLKEQVNPPDPQYPMVAAQALPIFQAASPLDDLLYGFDGYCQSMNESRPPKKIHLTMEPFDSQKHIRGTEKSGGNTSDDAGARQNRKRDR